MTKFRSSLLCAALISAGTLSTGASAVVFEKEIFGISNVSGSFIYRVDLTAGTVTNLGSIAAETNSFATNLAMSPGRKLYFMNPFEDVVGAKPDHWLYSADLNATNTALVNIQFVKQLPTNTFGIIDGFTVGPDGRIYMTGYGKSEIYSYDPLTETFRTEVRLVAPPTGGPAGEFRSDLAFDPLTGNLVGIGIEPGSSDRTLFEIPLGIATNGLTDDYVWQYYGGPASAWATKVLNTGSELGGNPDGVAYDPTNGDLFLSGDGDGIYSYNRTTAVRGALITGTGNPTPSLGWDLAFQTREVPLEAPEPGSLALLAAALSGLGLATRRRR